MNARSLFFRDEPSTDNATARGPGDDNQDGDGTDADPAMSAMSSGRSWPRG
jgi:hypothetical protein